MSNKDGKGSVGAGAEGAGQDMDSHPRRSAQASQAEVVWKASPLLIQWQLLALDEDELQRPARARGRPSHDKHVPRVSRSLQRVWTAVGGGRGEVVGEVKGERRGLGTEGLMQPRRCGGTEREGLLAGSP